MQQCDQQRRWQESDTVTPIALPTCDLCGRLPSESHRTSPHVEGHAPTCSAKPVHPRESAPLFPLQYQPHSLQLTPLPNRAPPNRRGRIKRGRGLRKALDLSSVLSTSPFFAALLWLLSCCCWQESDAVSTHNNPLVTFDRKVTPHPSLSLILTKPPQTPPQASPPPPWPPQHCSLQRQRQP